MKPKVVVQIAIDQEDRLSFATSSANKITTAGMVIVGLFSWLFNQQTKSEESKIVVPEFN